MKRARVEEAFEQYTNAKEALITARKEAMDEAYQTRKVEVFAEIEELLPNPDWKEYLEEIEFTGSFCRLMSGYHITTCYYDRQLNIDPLGRQKGAYVKNMFTKEKSKKRFTCNVELTPELKKMRAKFNKRAPYYVWFFESNIPAMLDSVFRVQRKIMQEFEI